MQRAEAVKDPPECAAELRTRFGVSEPAARLGARDDSDVAVTVSFVGAPSFNNLVELEDYLTTQ